MVILCSLIKSELCDLGAISLNFKMCFILSTHPNLQLTWIHCKFTTRHKFFLSNSPIPEIAPYALWKSFVVCRKMPIIQCIINVILHCSYKSGNKSQVQVSCFTCTVHVARIDMTNERLQNKHIKTTWIGPSFYGQHVMGMLDCAPLIIISDVCLTNHTSSVARWFRRWSRKPEISGFDSQAGTVFLLPLLFTETKAGNKV